MKLKQWLYGAAALAMLAACSDRDVHQSGITDEGGDGYISINIQLPTVPSTRAEFNENKTGNDNFDDGVSSEYVVNDAILVLFQGSSMETATYKGAFNLQNSADYEDHGEANDQVTLHITRVANVSGIDNTQKLFALVMVNGDKHGIYSTESPEQTWMSGTIADFQEYPIENKLFIQSKPGEEYASNIFMTNTPLSTKSGGLTDPETIEKALPVLVELNPKTYETALMALENPAATINVERAVGKVTCSKFNKTTGENSKPLTIICDGKEYELEVSGVSWGLAQDMKSTFVVRNTNRTNKGSTNKLWTWDLANEKATATSGKYRMLGDVTLKSKDKDGVMQSYSRPYFCRVPGYGKPAMTGEGDNAKEDPNKEDKKFVTESIETTGNTYALVNKGDYFAASGAYYPRENTFPVDYMKYCNSTRIGFWVNFNFKPKDGAPAIGDVSDFYIKGADKSTIYTKVGGNDPLTANAIQELSSRTDVKEAVTKALLTGKDTGLISGFSIGNCLKFDYDEVEKAKSGRIKITGINFISDKNDDCYKDAFARAPEFVFTDQIISDLNSYGQFYEYKGGKVFYEVRIKHFGDELTPWTIDDNAAATTINESYGTDIDLRNKNFLGRYGVVRNNWYDLNVNAITKLGDPRDPQKWDANWPGKPDDNKDQYISVELHVLSWAKRTQTVTF